ncbi:MAG: PQQ-binding-like beta-propeller repeat protein [Verrucomicrobiales bacterium]|nr:PQQ-binding-like beta-propeller repeat protein [Verrucomicrobiales bacterium]
MNVFSYRFFPAVFALAFPASLCGEDWPHFLGPNHDFHSAETGLNLEYSEEGPKLLWEVERGKGHAGPVIADGKLVFIHQVEKQEEIRCLDAGTGTEIWKHAYAVDVAQSYGITDMPRSSPVIDPETKHVYSLGNDGDLLCLQLDDGKIVWQKRLEKEFGPSPFFFGYGSSPLVYGEKLIVQVGSDEHCVVALNKKDGSVIWSNDHEWNGSYASPVIGQVNGEDRLFVFAGGMVKPPHGGLLCIDPESGTILDAFSWRSDNFASVNAATPVPCGPNRIFLTEDYGLGGVMLQYGPDSKARVVWTSPEFGCQFQTPIYHDGIIHGFGGNGGLMLAFDAATGRMLWNEAFYDTTIQWKDRPIPISLGHAHLIHVDGGFLCLSENGALLRMDLGPGGFQILSKARLFYAPETWAPPAISNGLLYINQNEMGSRLLCYDLRKKME